MRANKKKTKKVPKAQLGMIIGAAASAVPQALAAWQGFKAQKEAKAEEASLKAMMPSMTSQEDYYNYYQKQYPYAKLTCISFRKLPSCIRKPSLCFLFTRN